MFFMKNSADKQSYEIEIKSLLGSKEKAEELKAKLTQKDPGLKLVGVGRQLNHYFNMPEDLSVLEKVMTPFIEKDRIGSLRKIATEGKKVSIRTRDADGKVIFVIKASINDHTSSNGVSRIEFESPVKLTIAELDQVLLDAGLTYQAKWSREREEYKSGNVNICIDKNAGYGYLAEFERVVDDEAIVSDVEKDLISFMEELGAIELDQARLERMFSHYNEHWPEYYGTDKIFVIE